MRKALRGKTRARPVAVAGRLRAGLALLAVMLLVAGVLVTNRMMIDETGTPSAGSNPVGGATGETTTEELAEEPPPLPPDSVPPPPPTGEEQLPAIPGWEAITKIYYDPAQDTAPEPYLAQGAADLEAQLELVRPNSFAVTSSVPTTPAVRLLVAPALPQFASASAEAFMLTTASDGITVTGKTPLAVRHGVYKLLDDLGFRWFFPHPAWSVAPRTLVAPATSGGVQAPAYQERKISVPAGFLQATDQGAELHRLWRARNRLDSNVAYPTHHSYEAFAPLMEMAAEHPEAVCRDAAGKPQNVRPSAPAVIGRAKDWASRYFDKPEALKQGWLAAPVSPNDGGQKCPEWTKPDGKVDVQKATDAVFGLASEVARHLQGARPGKYASVLSYNVYSSLPSVKLEPNLFVLVTADLGVVGTQLTLAERLDGFRARGVKTGVYEYLNVWQYTHDRPYGPGKMREKLESVGTGASVGASAYVAEAGDNWGAKGRAYWLASRLTWSPDGGVDAALEDFYEKAFGSAKVPMKRYFSRMDAEGSSYSAQAAFADLDEAWRLARAGDADVEERIRQLVLYTYYDWRWGAGISNEYAFSGEEMKALYNYVWRLTNLHLITVKPEKGAIGKRLREQFGLSDGQVRDLEDSTSPSAAEVRRLLDEARGSGTGDVSTSTSTAKPRASATTAAPQTTTTTAGTVPLL